ncbi:OB-fold domain-containing protein [Sphingomonas sp. RB3P16]|uniref:Zn-ribbon domain-containing OB-fold protein n=1 Tax=Parasphingomonas frigoris TaxID=3096163 RepID=UPI002FC60071
MTPDVSLFATDAPLRLLAARDRTTGRIVFPPRDDARLEPIMLGRRGTLWSYTVQRFRPKTPPYGGPEAFEPWALGYVELPGEIIIEARLTGIAFDAIRIGMALELTEVPLDPSVADSLRLPAFRPAAEATA